jgi:hypothetical protein
VLFRSNVKDQNVLVIVGVDPETMNAVVNMEDAKGAADRRVKELDGQMTQERGGKESGRLEAGLIDSETLTKRVDAIADQMPNKGNSTDYGSRAAPLSTPGTPRTDAGRTGPAR